MIKQIYNQKAFDPPMIYFLLKLRLIGVLTWWIQKLSMNYIVKKRLTQVFEKNVLEDGSDSAEDLSHAKELHGEDMELAIHDLIILETEQTVKVFNNFEAEFDDELLLSMLIQKKWHSEYIDSLMVLTINQHGSQFLILLEVLN